jgi:ribosome-associated protein
MDRIKIPFSEFTFSFARSSGAGGQNINKVNTKAVMYWDIELSESISWDIKERFKARYGNYIVEGGQVQITSQKNRTQKANIDDCIAKLHVMLEEVRFPPKPRKKTKPKRSAIEKRLKGKKIDSEKKRMRKNDY